MTRVHHWRFHDGVSSINPGGIIKLVPDRGWYCWVYPEDDSVFEQWMVENCPDAEFQHRFNGGDPMYTVYMWNDKEAIYFEFEWVKKNEEKEN
jgi:hypothetical protein